MEYRKATFADIEEIYHLVNDYATDGVMLARSRNTLYETLRDMIVAIDDEGKVVGVGGLHIIWDRLAEIRTMAVAPDMTRQGIGAEIVRRLIEEGDVFGVEKYFTLTYKPGFSRSSASRRSRKKNCRTRSGRNASTARSSRTAMRSRWSASDCRLCDTRDRGNTCLRGLP